MEVGNTGSVNVLLFSANNLGLIGDVNKKHGVYDDGSQIAWLLLL